MDRLRSMAATHSERPDAGGITGAQASLYARARSALDQVLPLLDGLYPLRADADPHDVEAQRAVVRSGLVELVREFGAEGGPRAQRLASQFLLLIGSEGLPGAAHPEEAEEVGGELEQLRQDFGLSRQVVNTIDEEKNRTNFLLLVDYVVFLKRSWDRQRKFFVRPYLGAQLVTAARALGVVAESVQETYSAMDSVFLGAAERQVAQLRLTEGPLFVAELLAWVECVATREGPRLIHDGGKSGIRALRPTLEKLGQLIRSALVPPLGAEDVAAGYGTPRVQASLRKLAERLEEAAATIDRLLAEVPSAPSAASKSPESTGRNPQIAST